MIMLIPLSPFFSRVSFPGILKGDVYFTCSDKSKKMFSKIDSNNIFGIVDRGYKLDFNFSDFSDFLILSIAFIKRFKFSFWFYPEMMLIPEMIKVNRALVAADINELYITNQYDRWAYFLTNLKLGCKVNLHQHGLVSHEYQPRNKISAVQSLLCYDEDQLRIFKKHIVENVTVVTIRAPFIFLHPDLGGSAVLLCCTSNNEYFHLENEIFNFLFDEERVVVAVKPHPNNNSRYSGFNNKFIGDSFPRVRVVIHFNSTLEVEYKNSDPNVLTINAAKTPINDIVDSVLRVTK
ncbi:MULTISPECIES: hypothetical protein [Enterovibrio]|uniref:hypothetical protein n=1 Tax=Enterovibrio TaxID=188143 RepID=UPI00114CCFBC|nr:hypothetical protein [Enterovibrio norvegicus]